MIFSGWGQLYNGHKHAFLRAGQHGLVYLLDAQAISYQLQTLLNEPTADQKNDCGLANFA